jgi:hypothetical protein
MATFQANQVTATTDGKGEFTHSFGSDIDNVMATVNGPQEAGQGKAVVACTATQTGARQVTVRCWRATGSPDAGSVEAAASEQVTVMLLGITGS